MAGRLTLTMIKPNAVRNNYIGPILAKINEAGFRIVAMKYTRLTKNQARKFYVEHKDKHFFDDLVDFIISGPIVAILLEKENAVADFRKLIGATDPQYAEEGTIRKLFAESKQNNAIHGSDSDESAERESDFFFSMTERFEYDISKINT